MTSENHRNLIKSARGKSYREVEALVAAISPKPSPRDVIRTIAVSPAPPAEPISMPEGQAQELSLDAAPLVETVRIAFSASGKFRAKLKRCTDLLRNKLPFADLADIFDEAMEAFLDRADPDRRTKRPQIRSSNPHARKIPRWVRDTVWRRDKGRCGFVAKDGRGCEATAFLEFDHKKPWSLGGCSDDPENIRLLCRTHNQAAARALFGPA